MHPTYLVPLESGLLRDSFIIICKFPKAAEQGNVSCPVGLLWELLTLKSQNILEMVPYRHLLVATSNKILTSAYKLVTSLICSLKTNTLKTFSDKILLS